ncbi:MAG: SDR family NAD(P)-dependent oxidoreductase, partial [Calditrichaeota bacterium]|nr:SDR family NAD(P)-dependent oxidoreductase [Calditrichota bacterium]
TSGLGLFPKADGLVYSATKAALHNFTIGLRFALKDFGIQVLEFIPPVTDTKMTAARNEAKYDTAKLIQAILPQLKRDKKTVTITQIRIFKWISVLFPALANKILSKNKIDCDWLFFLSIAPLLITVPVWIIRNCISS